jgi:hypothetical protein
MNKIYASSREAWTLGDDEHWSPLSSMYNSRHLTPQYMGHCVAGHLGLAEAWRLILVCRAACAGAKEFLGTLPSFVVCGGGLAVRSGLVSDV